MANIQNKNEMQYDMLRSVVETIKTAILQSQARAAQFVTQEQLGLYYGIGRYVSEHSRKGYWGTGAIENISTMLKSEMPGLKGFSAENIKLMRRFYEAWKDIEVNSVVETTEIADDKHLQALPNSVVATTELQTGSFDTIHQLQLTNDELFPVTAFLNISFTHHVTIFRNVKDYEERKYYIQLAYQQRLTVDGLERMIKSDAYKHQETLPNNFLQTIPDKQMALRTLKMFKDSYLLDYINVEEIDESDPEDVDEKVIESKIVMNIKNFIMTFGKSFTYKGHQVHYDKLGHDHWIDLLFFNRELQSLVVVELKKGQFKPSYLGQLAATSASLMTMRNSLERTRRSALYSARKPTKPMYSMYCRTIESLWAWPRTNRCRTGFANCCHQRKICLNSFRKLDNI